MMGKESSMQKTLNVNGMMCPKCVARVEKALNGIEGVQKVEVSLEGKNAVVDCGDDLDAQELVDAVTKAGYEAALA